MYTKLFSQIIHSTIWREDNTTRLLWVTMLAMADKDGCIWASLPGLADAARISVEECEQGLAKLMSPDAYSRTPDHEGRRIVAINGGWRILNYGKYNIIDRPESTSSGFQKPSLEELLAYKEEIGFSNFSPQVFLDYYESNGWYVGSSKMKSWKAVVRTWQKRQNEKKIDKEKSKLFPIQGKTCSVKGCGMPAVYKKSGEYDTYYCGHHMPEKLKERYTF